MIPDSWKHILHNQKVEDNKDNSKLVLVEELKSVAKV